MNESIQSGPTSPPVVLCVDDEANILSALRRLFRSTGFRILTAGGGVEGLNLLEAEAGNVDLVISDMRMPEMDGAHLLAQVRTRWPHIVRILLTGYADMESTIAAINDGQIYRYISKPWNDAEVLLTVRDALQRKELEKEKLRLEALTRQQNEELKNINLGLEQKVAERTRELSLAHEKLKKSFFTSIQLFSNMIELRSGHMAGHSHRVAEIGLKIARTMGFNEQDCQDVFLASLLHDIGKINFPDELLSKPINHMNGTELGTWRRHAVKGELALLSIESFRGIAAIIRAHHEHFDGKGFPDGLSGISIPPGARVVAVANEYDGLLNGSLIGKRLQEDEARKFIAQGRGKRYDPQVVDAFLGVSGKPDKTIVEEVEMTTGELIPGMQLSQSLLTNEGIVLLTSNYVLDENLISQLRAFERTDGYHLKLWIKSGSIRHT